MWNHLCNFGRRHHEEKFYEIVEFQPVVQEMSFKVISYLELWRSFCSAERNYLSMGYVGMGYYEEQFYEIILYLDKWFRRCRLKDILSRALAALIFGGAEPFMQFSCGHYGEHLYEKGIMGNIHVKLL